VSHGLLDNQGRSHFILCGVAHFVIIQHQRFTLSFDHHVLTAQSNMALSSEYKTADLDVLEQGSSDYEKKQAIPASLQSVGHHGLNGLEVRIALRVTTLMTRLTESQRYINLASVVNFGVIILASWESFAVTFQFALTNGGPASIFYGSLLAGIGACAVGFSLAELASMYGL
jgi:choline transport protein